MTNSILTEVSPTSLDELFNKDPWEMSDNDVEKIVEALRRDRERWAQTPEGKGEKKQKKVAAPEGLKLDDLDV